MRVLIYLLLWGSIAYLLWTWSRRRGAFQNTSSQENETVKSRARFRQKKNPQEAWVQVYETASMDEARIVQARLQEEEIECVVYEQGKKDIHGNALKGVGLAVPKTSVSLAQGIISRMPV